MTKIGIIRCAERAKQCAGYKCFPTVREKTAAMAEYSDVVELVGFDDCGGCPIKGPEATVERAKRLKSAGAEVIHLGNCLVGYCPWAKQLQEAVATATGLPVALKVHS